MTIIPLQDETLAHIYRCGVCGFVMMKQVIGPRVSCATGHSPGSCCHYGEKGIDDATLGRLEELGIVPPSGPIAEGDVKKGEFVVHTEHGRVRVPGREG